MCGRYLIEDEAYADILEILNNLNAVKNPSGVVDRSGASDVKNPGEFARGEIFPTNIAPVISGDGVMAVKWGFPHWKNSGVIINARAETALEKNMFGKPLREWRCVVPSSGFFEWSRSSGKKKKDKYFLFHPEEHMLYMAGMVNTFRDALGSEYNAFVILTTEANDFVAPIHDRMPVILTSDEVEQWTQDDAFMESVLHRPGPELAVEMVG